MLGPSDVEGRYRGNVLALHGDAKRLAPKAPALTGRTLPDDHVLFDLGARPLRVGFFPAALEIRDNAFEPGAVIGTAHFFAAITEENEINDFFRKILHRRIERESISSGKILEHPPIPRLPPHTVRCAGPWPDGSLPKGQVGIRKHEVNVDLER